MKEIPACAHEQRKHEEAWLLHDYSYFDIMRERYSTMNVYYESVFILHSELTDQGSL